MLLIVYWEIFKTVIPENMMEEYILNEDIKVMYVTAESFPDGVLAAHQKLHTMFPADEKRRYFGISMPNEECTIIYKAAVEEIADGEAEKFGLETFRIKKGVFISALILDFMRDVSEVGKTFEKLLEHPNLDPNGYCLEIYNNETDVRCMVGLKK
ncbi:transcriptional regulator [Pedobacter psychrodurus]|uniref:transcriptional regulator n=1 Tax=Pedobacter psychrodurus TaxID=2530456 RepID=UPI00292D8495|nr:transcriptional regulator [Pedobacter psychrodurus]